MAHARLAARVAATVMVVALKIVSLSGDALLVEGSGLDGCVTKGAHFTILLGAVRSLVLAPAP